MRTRKRSIEDLRDEGINFASRASDQVRIETPAEVIGDTGDVSKTWAELDTVWAITKFLSSTEYVEGNYRVLRSDCEFVIRYRSDVNSGQRIIFDDAEYLIKSIVPIVRKKYLQIVGATFREVVV